MSATPRTIAVVTGTRAEYGLLKGLMRRLANDPAYRLRVVVTGAHLSVEHGETWRAIVNDGFEIAARVPLLPEEDSRLAMAVATGEGAAAFARTLTDLAPNLIVVLGDRYEILAAAMAATLLGLPLAHLHGGEITEGAVDDIIRHAVSKMACIHFVAAARYADRLVCMGERPDSVHVVGAMGLDRLADCPPLTLRMVEELLGLAPRRPLFLVTYHPETATGLSSIEGATALTTALEHWPEATVAMTGSNADAGGRQVAAVLRAYAAARPDRRTYVSNLGDENYLGLMGAADAVIGNSSSGILETPSLGVPTVNVGDRQKGRLRSPSVIDCAANADAIRAAIDRSLTPAHHAACKERRSPFGGPGAADRVKTILDTWTVPATVRKPFHDLSLFRPMESPSSHDS